MNKVKDGTSRWEPLPDWINANLMQAHRGVFARDGRLVIFGNDGLDSDPRAQSEFQAVKDWLASRGYVVEFSGSDSSESYTWCLVVSRPFGVDAMAVEEAVWQAWKEAYGVHDEGVVFEMVQRRIALEACSAADDGSLCVGAN